MKVLIFDLEIYKNDVFDIVTSYLKNIEAYKTNEKKTFLNKLNNNHYDLLIIDVSTTLGDCVFEEAINLNEKHNILVLSNTLTYHTGLSCKECSLKYNRKLLLKPLKANELINYIQNYEKLSCTYSIVSNNIIEILEDVMKQFIYYIYKKDEAKIIFLGKSNNTKELISIIDLLNFHKIEYLIDNDDIHLTI